MTTAGIPTPAAAPAPLVIEVHPPTDDGQPARAVFAAGAGLVIAGLAPGAFGQVIGAAVQAFLDGNLPVS